MPNFSSKGEAMGLIVALISLLQTHVSPPLQTFISWIVVLGCIVLLSHLTGDRDHLSQGGYFR
jgi:hypothetical protein